MVTMDGLAVAGVTPIDFLLGGRGANVANAKLAFETLHWDHGVTS
jgi:succinyl-CoA synthetase beta subunit